MQASSVLIIHEDDMTFQVPLCCCIIPLVMRKNSRKSKTMERQLLVLAGSACCNEVSCSHIPDGYHSNWYDDLYQWILI